MWSDRTRDMSNVYCNQMYYWNIQWAMDEEMTTTTTTRKDSVETQLTRCEEKYVGWTHFLPSLNYYDYIVPVRILLNVTYCTLSSEEFYFSKEKDEAVKNECTPVFLKDTGVVVVILSLKSFSRRRRDLWMKGNHFRDFHTHLFEWPFFTEDMSPNKLVYLFFVYLTSLSIRSWQRRELQEKYFSFSTNFWNEVTLKERVKGG